MNPLLKTYAFPRCLNISNNITLPYKFNGFIIHDFKHGSFRDKEMLTDKINNYQSERLGSSSRYKYVIEKRNKHQTSQYPLTRGKLMSFYRLSKLVLYNRLHIDLFMQTSSKQVWSIDNICESKTIFWNHTVLARNELNRLEKLEKIIRLNEKQNNMRLLRSLYLWENANAYQSTHLEQGYLMDMILSLSASLEVILKDDGERTSTSDLALRLSWLLFPKSQKKREVLFGDFKDFYNLRNNIIHGNKWGKQQAVNRKLAKARHLHEITRNLLLSILENKKAYKVYINKNRGTLKAYLLKLSLGKGSLSPNY